MGYKIDESNINLMGLSNGGSVSNIAQRNFGSKFHSITYISTFIENTSHTNKVLLIGGGLDPSSATLLLGAAALKQNNIPTYLLWDKNDTHFMIMNKQKEVEDFLNQHLIGNN